ncbi:MBL fold metallo-hydrolase [Patescibacteria group bacterium]|nr:MBL fold metallo-hydrolase [Patescibacteria group bacterium]
MKLIRTILIILLFLNVFSWSVIFHFSQANGLEVYFLDIGMGDSIFIQADSGHQILIDGGPDDRVIKKMEERMPFWDRTIDLIILTHPDKDHMFGLIEVLERYKVENILWTGIKTDTLLAGEWEEAIQNEGAKIWIAEQDLNIKISKYQYINLLYPFEKLEGREISDKNNSSIVLVLNSNGHRILFTGDAEKKVEQWLIDNDSDLNAQILKVSHHGSKTGSSLQFLETVQPDIAIICASSDNQYGFPHEETLANLNESGITILQTSNYKKDICFIQKKNEPFLFSNQTQ